MVPGFRMLEALLYVSVARAFQAPVQTDFGTDLDSLVGWNPSPTTVGGFFGLARRQNSFPTSVCGYVGTSPLSCQGTLSYCGWRDDIKAVGCCSTYYITNGQYEMSMCRFFTTCLASTAQCDTACSSDSYLGICGFATAGNCFRYTFAASNTGIIYTSFGCTSKPLVAGVTVLQTPEVTLTSDSTSASQTTSSLTKSNRTTVQQSSREQTREKQTSTQPIPSESSTSPPVHQTNGLSTGQQVGIGVGVGAVILVAITAFAICLYQAKKKSELKQQPNQGVVVEVPEHSNEWPLRNHGPRVDYEQGQGIFIIPTRY